MSSSVSNRRALRGGEFLISGTDPKSIFTRDDIEDIQREVASAVRAFFEKEVVPRDEEIEALKIVTTSGDAIRTALSGILGQNVNLSNEKLAQIITAMIQKNGTPAVIDNK